jgi:hypothetical protein
LELCDAEKVCKSGQQSDQWGSWGGLVDIVMWLGVFHMKCKHKGNTVVVCRAFLIPHLCVNMFSLR